MSKERLDNSVLNNAISTYKTVVEVVGDIIDEDYSLVLDKATLSFLEELKQYRNLEEQCLLLRLPVAVGSKVYEIIEETVPKHHYYIAEYEVQNVSAKAVMYADDWYSFDYPDLYFSRAEAEEKLRELEGK